MDTIIFKVNPNSGNYVLFRCYHHINPHMSNDISEETVMEYSEIYVLRIRRLCKERHIAINKLATMSDIKQSTLDNIVRGLTKNHGVNQNNHGARKKYIPALCTSCNFFSVIYPIEHES